MKKEKKKLEKRNLKEFVPDLLKQTIRDQTPFKKIDQLSRNYISLEEPSALLPEWDTCKEDLKDQIKLFSLNDASKLFTDISTESINVPSTLLNNSFDIKWLRPEEYLKEKYIEQELLKSLPNRNPIKMKIKLKEYYEMDNKASIDSSKYDKNDEETEHERRYLKKFYPLLLPQKFNIYVVNTIEKELTDFEIKLQKLEDDDKNIKQKKSSSPVKKQKQDKEDDKLITKKPHPSNLNKKTFNNKFSKWITGIFDLLLTMNIGDAAVRYLINIY